MVFYCIELPSCILITYYKKLWEARAVSSVSSACLAYVKEGQGSIPTATEREGKSQDFECFRLDICPVVGLLDHTVVLFLYFNEMK